METWRLGLVFPGAPRDPSTWSGTPAGVARGLEQAGVAVVPVRAEPPAGLDTLAKYAVAGFHFRRAVRSPLAPTRPLARALARASPELGAVQGLAARSRLRRAGPLDGLVQIGTGFLIALNGTPLVTFEDLTVRQAVELGYPEWRLLPRRSIAARIARQARAYELARACCVTTRWAAESVVRDYGVPAEKVHVVGLGRNHSIEPAARDWNRPRFLFVAKGWEGKNGPALLRAFARVKRDLPEAQLDLVGDHPPVAAEGVTGHGFLRLDLPEHRRALGALFAHATCFVMPSRYEASAIAYLDAGAAGMPCIGTSIGGSGELIGEAGRLVDPGDDDALVAAMHELADPATAARLGALAHERSRLFTWRAVAERLLRALDFPGALAEFL